MTRTQWPFRRGKDRGHTWQVPSITMLWNAGSFSRSVEPNFWLIRFTCIRVGSMGGLFTTPTARGAGVGKGEIKIPRQHPTDCSC